MKRLESTNAMSRSIEQIRGEGAFLIAKAGRQINTMTIGWATIGQVWGMPIMMVAVRPSRYTFGIIEKASDFAVSVPLPSLGKELAFCGSRSGRDCDKFKECGLATAAAQKIETPVLKIKGIHYECLMVTAVAMDPARIGNDVKSIYGSGDYHTLYFGKIEDCYETE
jgi:flavin reductase (DIM6/NTAB) family NADH-FMN oxidoreductase RutF